VQTGDKQQRQKIYTLRVQLFLFVIKDCLMLQLYEPDKNVINYFELLKD
tara:strand:+ start:248 stop:394 length:147 start_codon:yes stop_codon:yes gene_type:complete